MGGRPLKWLGWAEGGAGGREGGGGGETCVVWARAIIKRFVNQRLSGQGEPVYGPVSRLTPLVTLVINVHFWVICIDCMTCNKLVECRIESAWWSLSGIELSVYTHTGAWDCGVYMYSYCLCHSPCVLSGKWVDEWMGGWVSVCVSECACACVRVSACAYVSCSWIVYMGVYPRM